VIAAAINPKPISMMTTITAATPTRTLAAIPIPNTPGRRGARRLPYVTRSTGCCVVMI